MQPKLENLSKEEMEAFAQEHNALLEKHNAILMPILHSTADSLTAKVAIFKKPDASKATTNASEEVPSSSEATTEETS